MKLTHHAIILNQFYPAGTEINCSEDVAMTGYKQYQRQLVRQKINEKTGLDDGAMLGISTDSIHVLTYAVALLYQSINNAQSLKEVKDKTAHFANYADDFINKVESGELKLPYLTNPKKGGVAGVFNEVAKAATFTSMAMEEISHEQ